MEINNLLQLGLNKNEAHVYLALLKFGKANAHQLIRETKFHKVIVYDNLQRLIDKGLITYVKKDKKRIFSLESNAISIYLEKQEQELQQKKELASRIQKEIERSINVISEKQDAKVYEGVRAVKTFYLEVLKGGDYYILGAPIESVSIMGELFWDAHHLKRKSNKQKAYLLLNQSLKTWGQQQKDNYTKIRYLENKVEPKTETHIQDNVVAIIVWTEEPVVFKITSEAVALSYRKYFDLLWKQAKK